MIRPLLEGFRLVKRSWGLGFLILATNVLVAAVLVVPFQGVLESELSKKDAAYGMLNGFDYRWWSEWSSRQTGWTSSFGPDILGAGFSLKNLDLLLSGHLPGDLPAGLTEATRGRPGDETGMDRPAGIDGVILGLGVLYLV